MAENEDLLKEAQAKAEAKKKADAAKKAQQEAARKKKEEADAKREKERLAGLEQEKKNYQKEQKAKAEEKAKKEAEQKAQREKADKAKAEAERKRVVGNAYSTARNKAVAAAEKYAKTGNANDLKIYNNANTEYQKAKADYVKEFGSLPLGQGDVLKPAAPNRREDIGPSGEYAEPKIVKPTGPTGPAKDEKLAPTPTGTKITTPTGPSTPLTPTTPTGSANAVQVSENDPRVQKYITVLGYTKEQAIAQVQADVALLNAGGGSGGGSGSSTQQSYRLFSQQETAAFANQIAQQLIGRELSAEEIAQATQKLNTQIKATPVVTKTTGSTTVQTGGVDEQQFIKEQMQLTPEYSGYQMATTYFDSMLDALRGPAGGGI